MSRYALTPFESRSLDFFNDFFNLDSVHEASPFQKLHVDLVDKGNHYEITADLPGFKAEDLNIEVNEDTLTIQAERQESKECEEENYICRERSRSSFMRRFNISGINSDAITGNFEDGVLTLTLPKEKEEKSSARKIYLGGEQSTEEKSEK